MPQDLEARAMNMPRIRSRRCVAAARMMFLLVLGASVGCGWPAAAAQTTPQKPDWELVRSVMNPFGGTNDLVLIPEAKKRDEAYYVEIANAVCGERAHCMVNFWTDRAHIPTSANMPVPDLAVMTAHYERHPNYQTPVLHLACWLYPNKEAAERAQCDYMPGADIPWKK